MFNVSEKLKAWLDFFHPTTSQHIQLGDHYEYVAGSQLTSRSRLYFKNVPADTPGFDPRLTADKQASRRDPYPDMPGAMLVLDSALPLVLSSPRPLDKACNLTKECFNYPPNPGVFYCDLPLVHHAKLQSLFPPGTRMVHLRPVSREAYMLTAEIVTGEKVQLDIDEILAWPASYWRAAPEVISDNASEHGLVVGELTSTTGCNSQPVAGQLTS